MNQPPTFEQVKSLYLDGLTQCEVAARLSCSQKVVFSILKRNGFRCRKAAKRNQRGPKNSTWKGDNAKKEALHKRLYTLFGAPRKCKVCGVAGGPLTYEWANLTGKYTDPNDYKRMCRSCHRKHDRGHLNFKGAVGGCKLKREVMPNA